MTVKPSKIDEEDAFIESMHPPRRFEPWVVAGYVLVLAVAMTLAYASWQTLTPLFNLFSGHN